MVDSDYRIEEMVKNSAKDEFFDLLRRQGYDMSDLDPDTRIPKCLIPIIVKKDLNSFILFNSTLEHIHLNHDVSVVDMCKYLIEDYFEPTELLTLLQTNLYDALYLELSKLRGKDKKKISKFLIQ